jgi:serine/threonine protein kinase
VFSYGIVLYEMLHQVSPWECNDEFVLKQKIRTEAVRFKEGVSEELRDLIERCLRIKPEDRLTI